MRPNPPAAVLLLLALAGYAIGQNPSPAPLPQAPSVQKPSTQKSEGRVFGVPQYNVVAAGNVQPLTPDQKFRLFTRQTFDPFDFVGAAFTSGIGQATDEFPAYGQGTAGYAKRFGAASADSIDSSFWGGFVLPVLFKEDPRYFRLGQGSMKRRVGYAISRTFITRTDSGHSTFNFSSLLGDLIAGGISNAYYPAADRGLGLTFRRDAVVTGLGALGRIGMEFLPDVDRKIEHRRQKLSGDQ
jgi:hypothetical protein